MSIVSKQATFAIASLFALAVACETEERGDEAPTAASAGAPGKTDVPSAGAQSDAAGGGSLGQGDPPDASVGGATGGNGTQDDVAGAGTVADAGATGEEGVAEAFAGDVMPDEDAAALAAEPAQEDLPEHVQLPGGQSFADWYAVNEPRLEMFMADGPSLFRRAALASIGRDAFVADYAACQEWMVQDALWVYADEPPDPTTGIRPAQHGLAYVFGGKEPWARRASTDKVCAKQLHGMDCSGLVTLCAVFAGATFSPMHHGTRYLLEASNWNTQLPEGLKVATIADTEPPPPSGGALDTSGATYETGDVFVWKRSNGGIGHVGTVIRSAVGVRVAQSNGASGCAQGQWTWTPPECHQPAAQRDKLCDDNFLNPATGLNPTTGPNKKTFGSIVQHYSSSLYETRVFRIVNEIERASITVNGSAQDAGQIELSQDGQVETMEPMVADGIISFEAEFETDHVMTVTARPSAGSEAVFAGWSGSDCEGTEPTQTFKKRLTGIECTATFDCPAPLVWNAATGQCEGDSEGCAVPLVYCPNSQQYACPLCPAGKVLVDGEGCYCGCRNGTWDCYNGGCFDDSQCLCGFDPQACGCAAETCPYLTISQVTCGVLQRLDANQGTYRVTASGSAVNLTPGVYLDVFMRFHTPFESSICGVNGNDRLGRVSQNGWALTNEEAFSSRGCGAQPLMVTVSSGRREQTVTCEEP
jgi:hypothetical protein